MKANLNIEGFAFFEIEIEGSNVPPTMNMLDTIMIHEGIGIAIPTLHMLLHDQNGSLYRDLNLSNMTKIIITMAKTRETAKKKKFRLFGTRKESTSAGPILIVDCILDIPKWSTGSYCEPFVGTSSTAIGGAAAAAGMRYSGPRVPPADTMNWLNVNQTRSGFSEDVAMRGYCSDSSAMSRAVLSDSSVRYRDLMDTIKQEPTTVFLQSVPQASAKGKKSFSIRETKDSSISGFFTHYVNYGWKQADHSLNAAGQQLIKEYNAQVMGKALPINEEVRAMIPGARVSYVGDDPGTMPKPASNIHQFYEKAFYQNLRGLGLFSEKTTVLTDFFTEVEVFDPIDYMQQEQQGTKFVDVPGMSGRWLVAGKVMFIKNGHKYSEVFDLIRPFINQVGATNMTGGADPADPQATQQANANAGKFDIAGSSPGGKQATVESNVSKNIESQVATGNGVAPKITDVSAATNTMTALKDFAAVNPLIPTTIAPALGGSWPTTQLQSQDNLRNAVSSLAGANNPDLPVIGGDSLDGFKILKKVGAPLMDTLANIGNNPQEAVYLARNLEDKNWIKTQAMERATSVGSDITGVRLGSVVSAATGGYYSPGSIVGDVLGGGVWSTDLANAGIPLPDVDLPIIGAVTNFGGKLLFEATGIGLSGTNILIDPYKTAQVVEAFASGTTPQEYLARNGAEAFINAFGTLAPPEAEEALRSLGGLARDVMYAYSENEVITDSYLTNRLLKEGGRDIAFLFGDPGVVPIIDRVASVNEMAQYTEIDTDRKIVTWAQYYALGATVITAGTDTVEEVVAWKDPYAFPGPALTPDVSTGGYQDFFDAKTLSWYNNKGVV